MITFLCSRIGNKTKFLTRRPSSGQNVIQKLTKIDAKSEKTRCKKRTRNEEKQVMKTQRRWLQSALAETQKLDVQLPWTRQVRHAKNSQNTAHAKPAKVRVTA